MIMKRTVILAIALALTGISASAQNAGCPNVPVTTSNVVDTVCGLKDMRLQIDSLDNEIIDLLAKRMQVCLAVGKYKKEHGFAVVQPNRYNEILEKRSKLGTAKGLGEDFVKQIFELIHTESVRQQIAGNGSTF